MATVETSRHPGVYWHSRAQKWAAQAKVQGRTCHVGHYDDEAEAVRAIAAFWARQPTDWAARVVESMCDSKRSGLTFRAAWKLALREHPPRARDVGSAGGTLFNVDGSIDEPVVDAFERYCEDAWHGRRPKLAGFSLELLVASDWSRSARRGHLKVAA